ncbi:unannotated protein [freshwater metagenome]|uniref:Unannotated protein n=1 Tax=freshwater metagenome TaxID=449393 RepID=A0A6J6PJL4_9ZZZZ
MPRHVAVSVITLGELELGVIAAATVEQRARRAETLALARAADTIPINDAVMGSFARLVHDCREHGVKANVLDALIAATAIQHGLPVVTQDDDFAAMASAHPQLAVIQV